MWRSVGCRVGGRVGRARVRGPGMEALGEEGGEVPDWMPGDVRGGGGPGVRAASEGGAGRGAPAGARDGGGGWGVDVRGRLPEAVRHTPSCSLLGERYFVAWQGVLTLAFAGWAPSLEVLKAGLEDEHPGLLASENAGSRWPKVTLGCMRDGGSLTADQFDVLRAICDEETEALKREGRGAFAPPAGGAAEGLSLSGRRHTPWVLPVDRVAVSLYACRSMERLLHVSEMRLAPAPRSEREGGQRPSLEEAMRVQEVLKSWDDKEGYLAMANRSGNREHHYRGSALEASLCIFLHSQGQTLGEAPREPEARGAPLRPTGALGRRIEEASRAADDALEALLGGASAPGATPTVAVTVAATAADDAGVACARHASSEDALRRGNAAGHFLPASLVRLRRRVDAALPDLYVWFDDHALHVTLRALAPAC